MTKQPTQKKVVLAVSAFLGAFSITQQASAEFSCWSTWDPFACYLEEWFGNGNTQLQYAIELPNPETELYQNSLKALMERGEFGRNLFPESKEPTIARQTCTPEQLLAVAVETHSVGGTVEKCFEQSPRLTRPSGVIQLEEMQEIQRQVQQPLQRQ